MLLVEHPFSSYAQKVKTALCQGRLCLEWMVKSGGIDVVLTGLRDRNIRFPWPDGAV